MVVVQGRALHRQALAAVQRLPAIVWCLAACNVALAAALILTLLRSWPSTSGAGSSVQHNRNRGLTADGAAAAHKQDLNNDDAPDSPPGYQAPLRRRSWAQRLLPPVAPPALRGDVQLQPEPFLSQPHCIGAPPAQPLCDDEDEDFFPFGGYMAGTKAPAATRSSSGGGDARTALARRGAAVLSAIAAADEGCGTRDGAPPLSPQLAGDEGGGGTLAPGADEAGKGSIACAIIGGAELDEGSPGAWQLLRMSAGAGAVSAGRWTRDFAGRLIRAGRAASGAAVARASSGMGASLHKQDAFGDEGGQAKQVKDCEGRIGDD
jgi:hypothetical protein